MLSKITAAPLRSGWEEHSRGGRTPLGKGQKELPASVGPPPASGQAKKVEGLPALPGGRKGRQSDRPGKTNQIFKHGDFPFCGPWRLWGD